MAKIDGRGFSDEGGPNLDVGGHLSTGGSLNVGGNLNVTGSMGGVSPFRLNTTAIGNTSNTLTAPGMYVYTGGTSCTASLPLASSHPGAMCIIAPITTPTAGGILLTGSHVVPNVVFAAVTGSMTGATLEGSRITVAANGMITFISDGIRWNRMASSGSCTFA